MTEDGIDCNFQGQVRNPKTCVPADAAKFSQQHLDQADLAVAANADLRSPVSQALLIALAFPGYYEKYFGISLIP